MHVGDVTNHQYPQKPNGGNGLVNGLTIALLAGTIGLLAGPYIFDLINPDPVVVPDDTNTQYDLDVTIGK